MKKKAAISFAFTREYRFILGTYILVFVVASIAEYLKGVKVFNHIEYTHYNNFVIFKQSFYNFVQNKDLYTAYPDLFWDHFKYSPAFALLFAPLAILPDLPGLIIWNLINSLALFFALRYLPHLTDKQKALILWFVLIELLTSVQNAQSNGLMAALVVLTFNALENKEEASAALFLSLSVFIKIFSGVALLLALFYPRKGKFLGYFILWSLILALIPLTVVSPQQLVFLYKSWLRLLAGDHSVSLGISMLGWLQTWFGWMVSKYAVVAAGGIFLLLSFLRKEKYGDAQFRLLMLASLLVWMVIFNHKAESPTYVIAVTGIAIWYFMQPKRSGNYILLWLAFIFISLSPTDLFPAALRRNLVVPYVLKAVPAILIWFRMQGQLFFEQINNQ